MEEILRLGEVMKEVRPIVFEKIQSRMEMVMFIGTLIDEWSAEHDLSADEAHEIVETLNTIHADIMREIGLPPKMKKGEA